MNKQMIHIIDDLIYQRNLKEGWIEDRKETITLTQNKIIELTEELKDIYTTLETFKKMFPQEYLKAKQFKSTTEKEDETK